MNNFKHQIQHFTFIACLFFISTQILFAQQNHGKVKGVITTSDGGPAPGVNIILKNSKYGTVTNDDGSFEFNRVKANNYILQVTLTGYESIEKEVTVTENETTTLNFQLKVSNKELKEVTITNNKKKISSKESNYIARMPLKNLENPQVYSVINSKIIEQQVLTNFDDALKG